MEWKTDILGTNFESTTVDHHDGTRCTIIRHTETPSDTAILYIHGYSDYFFQSETAQTMVKAGYGFYAIDLRGYGRSLRSGDKMFAVRNDLSEYFADIESGVRIMLESGIRHIVLMGHSTGGLITSLYMATGSPASQITSLVLNSPFLDWNLPFAVRKIAIPFVSFLGRFFPNITVRQRPDASYARSLAKRLNGEWDYDHRWKPDILPDPESSWIRAIDRGQRRLMHHATEITVPVLLLHSGDTAHRGDPEDKFCRSDAILNVDLIARRGRRLGHRLTTVSIDGGLHDLSLSSAPVRSFFHDVIISWLDNTVKKP